MATRIQVRGSFSGHRQGTQGFSYVEASLQNGVYHKPLVCEGEKQGRIRDVPSNFHMLRVVGAALALSALLTACGKADPPPKPSAAHTAGVAMQQADDFVRSAFQGVIAENASNAGGMSCGAGCWHLTHLEKDDDGPRVSSWYQEATAAYAGSTDPVPADLSKWKALMDTIHADIKAWGDGGTWNKGVQIHPADIQVRIFQELDQADSLVNDIAPPKVRTQG